MAIAARSGCALKVAVNVSMRQFNDPRFPEVVRHALEVTGLALLHKSAHQRPRRSTGKLTA